MNHPKNSPSARLLCGPFPALEKELAGELKEIKRDDPLAAVNVLAGSNVLGLHLQRRLALDGIPHANVHFLTFRDLAIRIAPPEPGQREIPGLAATVLAGRALRELPEPSPVRRAARTRGAAVAAKQAFDRLRNGGLEPDRIAPSGNVTADALLAAYRSYQDGLRDRYFDSGVLFRRAAQQAGRLDGPLIVYGIFDLNWLQWELVLACAAAAPTLWLFPWEPDRRPVSEALRRRLIDSGFAEVEAASVVESPPASLLERILRHWPRLDSEPFLPDGSVRVVSCSDDVAEAVEAVRIATAYVAEHRTSWNRVAIVSRSQRSLSLVAETLHRHDISVYARKAQPATASPAGAAIRILLRLIAGDTSRSTVFNFLGRCEATEKIASQWAEIARDAGIAGGDEETWTGHLAAYEQARRPDLRDDDSGRGERLGGRIGDLRGELGKLFESLNSFPNRAEPSMFVKQLNDMIKRLPGSDEIDEIKKQIDKIARLDDEAPQITRDDFVELTAELLDSMTLSEGAYQDKGLFLGPIDEIRGLDFDLVTLTGMYERGFPALARDDPFLSDSAVEAINQRCDAHVEMEADRRALDELLFLQAAGAARDELVLTYPRSAAADGRERLPSHYVQRVIEMVAGEPVAIGDFRRADAAFVYTGAERAAVELPLGELDYDLGQIRQAESGRGALPAYLFDVSPNLERFHRQQQERWQGREFGEYDGVAGGDGAVAEILASRQLSPTAIENFVTCPYRFFASRLLGLEELSNPDQAEAISPLEAGSLIHLILEDAVGGWLDGTTPDPDSLLAAFDAVADKRFREVEERGVAGLAGLWERTSERMRRDARRYLEETARRDWAGGEWRPQAVEMKFGDFSEDYPEPIPLGAGKTNLRFHGLIDRVDLSADGRRVRVVDYKSGKKFGAEFKNGRHLQLPIYLMAALRRLEVDEGVAELHFLTRRGEYGRVDITSQQLDEWRPQMDALAALVGRHVSAGLFPPRPGNDNKNCRNCDFQRVCGANIDRWTRRKWRLDPAVDEYRETYVDQS